MTAFIIATALVVMAYAIWVRRDTFASSIERPLTVSALLCLLGITLISPQASAHTGAALHALTGLWHLDTCLGDLCLLAAQVTAVYALVGVLLDDTDRYAWMRVWVRPVLLVAPPHMIACMTLSQATRDGASNILDVTPDGWLIGYWLITCSAQIYLWTTALRILAVVCHDPPSRRIAYAYITAMIAGLTACALQMGWVLTRASVFDHPLVTWTLLCGAYAALCLASAHSWQVKKHRLYG